MKLLLGSEEYLRAIDHDFQFGFGLKNKNNFYQNSEILKIIDEYKQFNYERNNTFDYVLYGKIENLVDELLGSDFNLNQNNYTISVGYIDKIIPLPSEYIKILNIINDSIEISNSNVLLNDIILLLRNGNLLTRRVINVNSDGTIVLDDMNGISTQDIIIPSTAQYNRHFKELINVDYLRLFKSGFSTNIFNDQMYQYNTFKNINVKDLRNNFNIPVNSLYFKITPKFIYKNVYRLDLNTSINDSSIVDKVALDLNSLTLIQIDKIVTSFSFSGVDFFFLPYYENVYRTISDVVTDTNITNIFEIPDYAFKFSNGDIVFKEVMEIGSYQNGIGVDYPFINNLHYLYNDIKFYIRRNIPIADYSSLNQIDDDVYATDIINDTVGQQRLC